MSKIFTKVIVHTVNDLTDHYWLSEIVIWYRKKKEKLNALLSLFLTAYHYSLGVFFPAKDTKAGAIEGCQTWMSLTFSVTECMSSLDIYVSLTPEAIRILKLCVFLIVIFLLGLLQLDFNQVLRKWKNSLSSIPPTFPFTVCTPWPSARGMVLVALTAEYQECLKAGPFDVHYQCISAWLHCDCSTRMRCVDTFCWHLSLIYLYREDAWNVPVS